MSINVGKCQTNCGNNFLIAVHVWQTFASLGANFLKIQQMSATVGKCVQIVTHLGKSTGGSDSFWYSYGKFLGGNDLKLPGKHSSPKKGLDAIWGIIIRPMFRQFVPLTNC